MSEHIDGNVFVSNALLSSNLGIPPPCRFMILRRSLDVRAKARREKCLVARDTNRREGDQPQEGF